MIYAELAGGLGNQMFIYAFARTLALQSGEGLTLIDRQDGAVAHTAPALDALCIHPDTAFVRGADYAKRHLPRQNLGKTLMIKREQRGGGMLARDWNAFERRMAPALNRLGTHFATDGFVPCRRGSARDFLLWGYFQAEAYFAPCREQVLAELAPKRLPAAAAAALDAAACPVCVHIRRGDYQNPANAIFNVCTPAYYARAVRAAGARLPGAQLFVFSDDLAWARANLDCAGLPATFMAGGRTAAEDLALMCRCRHFILSNSTFSWWAQELAAAPEKTVLVPDHWYAGPKQTALYAPGWQRVPVE